MRTAGRVALAVALAVAFSLMNPTALSQVATELERIVAAVSMLDSFKMTQLGFAMSLMSDSAGATAPLRAAADLAIATAAVTPEAAESTEKMMNAVVNVIQAADAGAGLKFGDQITEILDSVKGIVAAGQGGEGGESCGGGAGRALGREGAARGRRRDESEEFEMTQLACCQH